MSIGKRLIDLARAELNDLLERAGSSSSEAHDPDDDLYRRYGMNTLTDEQLEAELERRRKARETAAKAARTERPRPTSRAAPPPPSPSHSDEIRRAYAALEVPQGSNFETVRKSYRTLMRKYHPDRHVQTPEKQKAANELSQKLGAAYKLLEKQLRK